MRRLLSILLWSVIAAAFVGPGTVTTAASAGASYGYSLLWALLFSTVACLLLQEASARLTVVSGRNLGQALREQYPRGPGRMAVTSLILGAILLGCAAYEAGNILGGVAGAVLATRLPAWVLTLASGAIAAVLLWRHSPRRVAHLLSLFVAVMGASFLATALLLRPPPPELLAGSLRPSLPAGSELLALALVGTTVVPYNLFLGSGIAGGQSLGELRFGLSVAVVLGGLLSMGVLVVGAAVSGPFSFEAVAAVLAERLGPWAGNLFAAGLCAAGLSSAITAPLAAAVTARSVLGGDGGSRRWGEGSGRYRAVWSGVLLFGLGFGLSGVRPIPAIIAAQALNGILLPLVAAFLLVAVNDRRLMGEAGLNRPLGNAALGVVVAVSVVLGIANLGRAASSGLGLPPPGEGALLGLSGLFLAAAAWPLAREIRRRRAGLPGGPPGEGPGR